MIQANNGGMPDIADPMVGVTTHTYNLKPFNTGDGKVVLLAVHSSVTNVFEALLKGYRYNRKPRYYPRQRKPKVGSNPGLFGMNPRYLMTDSGPVRIN